MRFLSPLLIFLGLGGAIAAIVPVALIPPDTSFSPDDQMLGLCILAVALAGLAAGLLARRLKRRLLMPVLAAMVVAQLLWICALSYNLRTTDDRRWSEAERERAPYLYVTYALKTEWLKGQQPQWYFFAITDARARLERAPHQWEALAFEEARRSDDPYKIWGYIDQARTFGLTHNTAAMRIRLDDKRFERAKSPSALRDYIMKRHFEKVEHRHLDAAKRKLADLYQLQAEEYERRTWGADREAVLGIKALLSYLGRYYEEPDLAVCFDKPKMMSKEAEQKMRAMIKMVTGSSDVTAIEIELGPETIRGHNDRIFKKMKHAFGQHFDREILELTRCTKKTGPRFEVTYTVAPHMNGYSLRSQDKVAKKSRRIYPAFKLDFAFEVKAGERAHRFAVSTVPAPNFKVTARKDSAPSTSSVYETMVNTAFGEFEQRLLAAHGLARLQ